MSEAIGTAMRNAVAYLRDHRDEARYTDSPATARVESGLKMQVEGPDGAAVTTDMPTGIGGGNSAPSPGWLMRAAQASCEATLIALRAAFEGVELANLEVTVDSESDDYGILGIDDSVPAGPLSARVQVKVAAASDTSEEQLRSIVHWAHEHCPVSDAIVRAVRTSLSVEVV
ncbi:MAG TPA: OsmC family protein [Actinomycetota bacterium]|nr:OsmC family protein [Actinomycetota bacterium]